MDKKDLKIAKEIELVESPSQPKDREGLQANSRLEGDDPATNSEAPEHTRELTQGSPQTSQIQHSANSDYLIGKVIGGHYEILSRIGQGGMSTVYKARHQLLKRDVAIKFLAVGRQFDGKAIQRFQEEARAAVGLQHSSICSTREFGINEDGIPYLVMDYVEGTSLGELLRQERTLSQPRTIELILGVCAGLQHAHESGVIHRDIKPANIIITKDKSGIETTKLVDFGIAKLIREDDSGPDLTQTGEVFGTPKYMSPEQCHGNKVDQRADIYALGCILFEMLTGQPPFNNESAIQILFAHINEEPPALGNSVSKDMQAIIDRCLQKDPSLRYQKIADLIADLDAVRDGEKPVHAQPRKPAKPRVAVVLATVFTLITIFAVLLSSLAMNRRADNNFTNQWESAHTTALQYRRAKNLAAEETQLEKCLKLAQESRNDSLISVTLQELSNVEESLGKTQDAEAHRKTLTNKIKVGGLSKLFIMAAFSLIGVGIAIFVASLILFGKNKNATLRDVFTKGK